MISVEVKGDFSKLNNYMEKLKRVVHLSKLDKYGNRGVDALRSMTPIESGLTANSWYYDIVNDGDSISIVFNNSNVNDGVPIAIVLQYGHGLQNGGWVEGRDYINPAIQPIFDEIVKDAWEEVINL